jgi:coenzyme F420-reducing hydrogenase beta subunit
MKAINIIIIMLLEQSNTHIRDKYISFFEEGHRYEVHGKDGFTSVTTWIHSLFDQFNADRVITGMMNGKNWKTSKYFGMTSDEIKKQWNDTAKESSSRNHVT